MPGRIIYVGGSDAAAVQLGRALGGDVSRALPDPCLDSDVYFLQAFVDAGGSQCLSALVGGNAFSACRALKAISRPRVYLLVREGDSVAPEVARFCLADGVVEVRGELLTADLGQLAERVSPHRRRVSVDDLLHRLESEIRADQGRQQSALRRLLRATPGQSIMSAITDADTGLFDGAYASLKIDEEFKRAIRFHQPLTLILLDLAPRAGLPAEPTQRRNVLAEAAGVFLNECRDIDVLARFTEGVFLFLLPGTGPAGAAVVARRILKALTVRPLAGVELVPCAGLTSVPAAGIDTRESFLVRAEACLLLAKDGSGDAGLYLDRE